ncbi:MAG: XRE family transcriptional regulator [Spirochaetia bacterium]|nr:XRE family transcriptional regulator [Spirochaetia bacterium]
MAERKGTAYRFGEKIRRIRERQKITLRTLSDAIGVSSSLLSQIENNHVSPSMDTLLAITDELQIDPEYLFRDYRKPRQVKIVHKEDRNRMMLEQVSYAQLSPPVDAREDFAFEVLELSIDAGGSRGSEQFGHPGREMGIILEGEASLAYGSKTYTLGTEDSVSFSSRVPHTLHNSGEKTLKAIWIVSPPRIFSGE